MFITVRLPKDVKLTPEAYQELTNNKEKNAAWEDKTKRLEQGRASGVLAFVLLAMYTIYYVCLGIFRLPFLTPLLSLLVLVLCLDYVSSAAT